MSAAAAAAAAERGWSVFPLPPGRKKATLKDWPNRACSDPERVARYWPSDRHNIAVACGPSRLVVVDLDAHEELPQEWQLPGVRDGRDVFAQICEWAGMDFPSTYTVATPNDGWHLYFTAPEGTSIGCSVSAIGPQIDVKADGGYVVGAGSAVDGKAYEVLYDEDPAPLPAWIARLLEPRAESVHAVNKFSPVRAARQAPRGTRPQGRGSTARRPDGPARVGRVPAGRDDRRP